MPLTPEKRHRALEISQGRISHSLKGMVLASGVSLGGKSIHMDMISVVYLPGMPTGEIHGTFRLVDSPTDEELERLIRDEEDA